MKRLLLITALALAGCTHHKEVPPGFKLMCNDKGQYMPASIHSDQPFFYAKPSSRQKAIDVAWEQYDYEYETAHYDFKDCKQWKLS